ALLLVLALVVAAWFSLAPKKSRTIHSIAVIPFVNQSSDKSTDYLSDGITDNMINRLSQLPDLKVLARGTVFTYKGKEVDPRTLGRNLDVDALVTGKVIQNAQEISVDVSLVRTVDGTQLWGDRYSGNIQEVQSFENEILRQIAGKLQPKMNEAVASQITK